MGSFAEKQANTPDKLNEMTLGAQQRTDTKQNNDIKIDEPSTPPKVKSAEKRNISAII